MSRDIPPQEQNRKWFRSHLLNRELELQELYDLPQGELDLVMAETAEIHSPQIPQHFTREMDLLWNSAEPGITAHIQRNLEHRKIPMRGWGRGVLEMGKVA
ncbi:hypothetical protein [Synechococcus sp. A15-44]|uniref:hypothetical protein n=1 Tax=Synechococcus sp. A15-44 TaxID=1050646 RepID=UPI0016467D96|nr:hypothetical protein [Synechococcus sp. A15-44]QNI63673.1 hypothetical protein SynA1544_00733 [Synechococcus sp. A15-44]